MSQLNRRLAHPETLKTLGLACGVVLAITFFLPYAEWSNSVVMAWDLASKDSKFAFLIIYPVIAGAALIVMSSLPNVPHTGRAVVTALAGLLPMVVFAFQIRDLAKAAQQGMPVAMLFILGMVALALGLTHRVVCSRSTAARVIVGLGMLLLAGYYLVPQQIVFDKEMPLVLLFKLLDNKRGAEVVTGILLLLPFFAMLGAGLALPKPAENPATERGILGLAWFFLCYLPGLVVILAVVVLAEKPGLHVIGLLNMAGICTAYQTLLVFGASHALLRVDTPDHIVAVPAPGPTVSPTDDPPWAQLTCSKCGSVLDHGERFCEDCGTPAGGATTPEPAATAKDGPARSAPAVRSDLVIGRDAACDYVLPENMEGASRQHARIFIEGGQIYIEDLGSANGTFLNGKAVKRSPLKPTDAVRFGKTAAPLAATVFLKRMGL